MIIHAPVRPPTRLSYVSIFGATALSLLTRRRHRYQRRSRSIQQRRVFGTVDEPGQVAIVPVRPAGGFIRQRRKDCKAA
jgi:hypothetical protein